MEILHGLHPAGVGSVEYLVVGGGGGGANGYDNAGGGGGGAGMVLTGRLAVTSGNVYPITIEMEEMEELIQEQIIGVLLDKIVFLEL